MRTFASLDDYHEETPLALTIGMFDGVHAGHQKIISNLKQKAQEKKLETAVLTFWPHPRLVFNPQESIKLLNTIDEKIELLKQNGVQKIFIQSFSQEFRNLSGNDFIDDILRDKLKVNYLVVGYDHTFGKNKSGNFRLLSERAQECNFEVQQMEAVSIQDVNVSSTKIRESLSSGEVIKANDMLGYPYPISGTVVHGKKIGRTLGYPTANIYVDPVKLLPKKGAYIVEVLVKGRARRGMLSIGTNPTLGENPVSVEVFILDFNENIYGEKITVKFRDFLHEEIKFESMEKLVGRLDEDKKLTENFNF